MNLRSSPLWLILAILLVLSLTLSACGGGQAEIKVGAPLPLTGPYASDGEQMLKALQMAVDEQNAKGGLLGR